MSRYTHFIALFVLFNIVHSFKPNCIKNNQFRYFSFPIEACSTTYEPKCEFLSSGYLRNLRQVSLVRILTIDVVPTCAFYELEGLKYVVGVNSDIKVLASGAFTNIVGIDSVNLAFNSITEIHKDVFQNISVQTMDFSWNKIVFIDADAFSQVYGLQHLNLSKNSLSTLSVRFLPGNLAHLNLSYNLLERVAINSERFHRLSEIDLSNNLIARIALDFSHPVRLIDLTDNQLEKFDFIEINSVDLFKIGRNRMENIPAYLENINADIIDIEGNPWNCEQLFTLFKKLTAFNMKLPPKDPSKAAQAECFNNGKRTVLYQRSPSCSEDYDCPERMTCRTKKCWDPCEHSMCHKTSRCESQNHKFKCTCPGKLIIDPLDVSGECRNVDCFLRSHCDETSICKDNKCLPIKINGSGIQYASSIDSDSEENVELVMRRQIPWWYDTIPKLKPATPSISTDSTV